MKIFIPHKAICVLVLLCFQGILLSQNIYVSPTGDDGSPGSLNSPKRTIQASIDELQAGDTLYFRAGTYHEEVSMVNMKGSSSKPIVFKSYMDEVAIIDGTIDLEKIKTAGSRWELATDDFPGTTNIYKLTLEEDIWQLFVKQPELMNAPNAVGGELADYRMQVVARWPNGITHPCDSLQRQANGTSAVVNTWWSFNTTWAFASDPLTTHTEIYNNSSRFNLAATGKSFEGGTAILSIYIMQKHYMQWGFSEMLRILLTGE